RERRQRRLLRGLPDHGIAADQRDCRVPRPYRHREIECGDDADRRERMPSLHHAMARPLRGDGEAVELAREAAREVADVEHRLDLAAAFLEDLAVLEGDEPAEIVLRPPELLTQKPDELAAVWRGHGAPLPKGRIGARDLGFDRRGAVALDQ